MENYLPKTNVGGFEQEYQTGAKYVIWPDAILNNPFFLKAINPVEYSYLKKSTDSATLSDVQKLNISTPNLYLKLKTAILLNPVLNLL
jgi:hypothetical protein